MPLRDPNRTSHPKLANAVLRTVGEDSIGDLARHGADAGWPGITYHSDTLTFYRKHKAEILSLAEQQADNFGQDLLQMIAGFGCLKSMELSPFEVAKALESKGDPDTVTQVQNAMCWYACEEMARELDTSW